MQCVPTAWSSVYCCVGKQHNTAGSQPRGGGDDPQGTAPARTHRVCPQEAPALHRLRAALGHILPDSGRCVHAAYGPVGQWPPCQGQVRAGVVRHEQRRPRELPQQVEVTFAWAVVRSRHVEQWACGHLSREGWPGTWVQHSWLPGQESSCLAVVYLVLLRKLACSTGKLNLTMSYHKIVILAEMYNL